MPKDAAVGTRYPEAQMAHLDSDADTLGLRLLPAIGLHPHRPRAGAELGRAVPKRASPFAAETLPAREVFTESRSLRGGGAAGVPTIGAAGIEVAPED